MYSRPRRAEAAAPGPDSESLLTPGVGVRLLTRFGPLRLDLGYDPSGPRTYAVIVSDSLGGIETLGPVRFDPYGIGGPGPLREFWRRIRVHVSTGQPF